MRSLARARSSSRRAPPNAASKPCSAIASSSVVGLQAVARGARAGLLDHAAAVDRVLHARRRSAARRARATRRSRNSITSGKLCPVSTCMSGNGKPAGPERLLGEAQQHDRVLAAAEQQHRALELGRDLAHDVDRLGLERAQVVELVGCGVMRCPWPAAHGAGSARLRCGDVGDRRRASAAAAPTTGTATIRDGTAPALLSRPSAEASSTIPSVGRRPLAGSAWRRLAPIHTPGTEPRGCSRPGRGRRCPRPSARAPATHSRIAAWKTSVPTTRRGLQAEEQDQADRDQRAAAGRGRRRARSPTRQPEHDGARPCARRSSGAIVSRSRSTHAWAGTARARARATPVEQQRARPRRRARRCRSRRRRRRGGGRARARRPARRGSSRTPSHSASRRSTVPWRKWRQPPTVLVTAA